MTSPQAPSYRVIHLTKSQVALVDEWEYEGVSRFKWYAWWNPSTKTFYAARTVRTPTGKICIYMHRQILGLDAGNAKLGDHHDRNNTLDNRWSNIRYANRTQNGGNSKMRSNNTSGYKGVCWDKRKGKWLAQIMVNRKHKHLGHYDIKEEAYAAYCKAALFYFGEFARFE